MGIKQYQKDAVNAALTAFQNDQKRYLVADETGLGKTYVAAGVIKELWAKRNQNDYFIVYYFGSNVLLLQDTMQKLSRHIEELLPNVDIQRFPNIDRLSVAFKAHPDLKKQLIQLGLPAQGNQRKLEKAKINLFAFSANLLDGKGSLQGNQKERDDIKLYLHATRRSTLAESFRQQEQAPEGLADLVKQYRKEMHEFAFKMKPALVICDEFHRYDERLYTLNGLNADVPQLYLSATPYNWVGNDWDCEEFKDGTESEGEDDTPRLNSFEDLLEELGASGIDTASSQTVMQYIYRNERPGASTRYEEIPGSENFKAYKECIEYYKTLLKPEGPFQSSYFRQAPGVYSFADYYKKEKGAEGYQDLLESLGNAFGVPKEWLLFDNEGNLKEDYIKKHLKLRVIHDEEFEAGQNLLWVPPTKPLYPFGGVYEDKQTFSKLLVFSAYKMVPRIVASVFSSLAPVGDDRNDFADIDAAAANHLAELTELYDGGARKSAADLVDEVIEKVEGSNEFSCLLRVYSKELLAQYVVAGPACCILRTMKKDQAGEWTAEQVEAAKKAAEAFGSYLGKLADVCGKTLGDQLQYCLDGNLQAMLYEYAFLRGDNWEKKLESNLKYDGSCVHVRTESNYLSPDKAIHCLFADRLTPDGKDTNVTATSTTGKEHHEAVKEAFNSPFWPMILTTTSAGQEGIDLDGYCRRIMHYSVPNSPMAFEQRDGRIDRFRSLLTRMRMVEMNNDGEFGNVKNDKNFWDNLFNENKGLSGMSPDWVPEGYEGKLKLQRLIAFFPYSKEDLAYRALLRCCDKYRGHFGQTTGEQTQKPVMLHELYK